MTGKLEIEKFSDTDLVGLRNDLMQSGLDSWQAAEVLSGFLTGRGYGVSPQTARDAVSRLEVFSRDLNNVRRELERLAIVM